MRFELARKIADAVLYEGYVLYPYRASSAKNRFRWQFGVVAPRGYSENGGCEPWEMQTEVLIESQGSPLVDIKVRFLQVQARSIEAASAGGQFEPVAELDVDGRLLVPWEEGIEREADLHAMPIADLLRAELSMPLEVPAERGSELVRGAAGEIKGRIVRERRPISAILKCSAEQLGSYVKLRVRIENLTPWETENDRAAAVRSSLTGAHTLLAVTDGAFISATDPPEAARAAAAACSNLHTWPVFAGLPGERDLMLSSPIILADYPAIAPESPGDLFDGTEIDEILTLRVMTLTDEEKREASGTDERAQRIIERSDSIPAQVFERLHGAIRSLKTPSFEEFFNPPGTDAPEQASVEIDGVRVSRGSRVRLQPKRRADSMDLFLAGRTARVESVQRDVENKTYVAVVVEDDPAGDLHEWYGRFFYFYPDELEIAEEARKEN